MKLPLKRKMIISNVSLISLILGGCTQPKEKLEQHPNIIIILADDLGYGDVSCYGATKLHTPNIDKLAQHGVRFTQAYSTSATCTPSRYALLTGEYPWKTKNAQILPGDAPLIISTSMQTLPKIMQQAGYKTGIVGKWHLGLGDGDIDWNKTISPATKGVGFDYSFIMPATNDRIPCVYMENDLVVGIDPDDPLHVNYKEKYPGEPTGKDHPELLKLHPSHGHDDAIVNGVSRIGFMRGGKKALWTDETMAETFLDKAIRFVESNERKPFFLYFALHQPHVPRVPNEKFIGKSGMGARGDAILELDWMVGKFLDKLEELKLAENTLIIFSSDNGPVLDDGYKDLANELLGGHKPSGPLRGGKGSLFEAGMRVPFITYWPGKIKSGVSNAIFCQVDLLASLANLVGVKVITPEDSKDLLAVLTGKSEKGREELIVEGVHNLAFRQGNWVMIPPHKGPSVQNFTFVETGRSPEYQLYNLSENIHQDINLADEKPEKLEQMKERFNELTQNEGATFR